MTREDFERYVWLIAVYAVAAVFAAVMLGNAIYGYQTNKLMGLATAIGISLLGGWLALAIGRASWAWRVPMGVLLLGCFLYTQIAGWRVMGVTMADAAVTRSAQATDRQVALDALEAKRAERKRIGVQRALSEVEPLERHECSITSARYKDGVGPKCSDLRSELGRVKRAAELDGEIAAAAAALGGKPQVAEGTPDLDAVAKALSVFWPATTSRDVGEWLPKFLVLFFDLVAYLGPMVLGLHGAGGGVSGGLGASGGPGGGGAGGMEDEDLRYRLAPPEGRSRIVLPGRAGTAGGGHSTINLTLGYPALPAPVGAPVSAPAADPARSAAGGGPEAMVVRRRRDLPALDSERPIDRSVVGAVEAAERPAADVLLGFRAACVLDSPGGVVDFEHLHRRYQRWAGERALALPAFRDLFQRATGIAVVDIGGHPHAGDVALRAPRAALREVA